MFVSESESESESASESVSARVRLFHLPVGEVPIYRVYNKVKECLLPDRVYYNVNAVVAYNIIATADTSSPLLLRMRKRHRMINFLFIISCHSQEHGNNDIGGRVVRVCYYSVINASSSSYLAAERALGIRGTKVRKERISYLCLSVTPKLKFNAGVIIQICTMIIIEIYTIYSRAAQEETQRVL